MVLEAVGVVPELAFLPATSFTAVVVVLRVLLVAITEWARVTTLV